MRQRQSAGPGAVKDFHWKRSSSIREPATWAMVNSACSASQRLFHTWFLRRATCMALNRNRVNMAFSLFIIPFLIFGFPYFPLPALAAGEWPVEVKVGKAAVSIDVRELTVVGCHGRGVI